MKHPRETKATGHHSVSLSSRPLDQERDGTNTTKTTLERSIVSPRRVRDDSGNNCVHSPDGGYNTRQLGVVVMAMVMVMVMVMVMAPWSVLDFTKQSKAKPSR